MRKRTLRSFFKLVCEQINGDDPSCDRSRLKDSVYEVIRVLTSEDAKMHGPSSQNERLKTFVELNILRAAVDTAPKRRKTK